MNSPASKTEPTDQPYVCLVGAGVVGKAIAKAHINAGVSFSIADQSEDALREAVSEWRLNDESWRVSPVIQLGQSLPAIQIVSTTNSPELSTPIVIESIAERLDVKRDFFALAEQIFGDDTILCSNTSTLRIGAIAEKLKRPERFCGMHFFMPVEKRDAVEVIRGEQTADSTVQVCRDHVRRIQKEPLAVGDGPGFVVNRLLSPYLNEAMLMLGRGVTAERIERAALAYGMPMSPLELIDLIGTRTTFDAGRVFWQSFPTRVDPAPILPAMVKKKRFGRSVGAGFYDYEAGQRSKGLSPSASALAEKYRRDAISISDDEVVHILSIPMWIEAAIAFRDRVATSHQQFDLAMHGGLGYQSNGTWLEYFESIGSQKIVEIIEHYGPIAKSLRAPADLVDALKHSSPTAAMDQFASCS
jgi:3-hydroxyacyl-CoA dehydrogenase